VHTAPGHGQEDYSTGIKYGLEVVMPVDEKGRFTEEAGEFKGINVHKANDIIADKLRSSGLLIHSDNITHSYPHCWRCKSPIIFRATEQWFMSIDHQQLRKKLLDEVEKVEWIPPQGQDRISSMIENRPDWCLSRQRYWGVPIPVFMCKKCRQWIADHVLIRHFAEIVKTQSSDAWFKMEPKELMPRGYKCPYPGCEGDDFKKGEDIVDVWFESGVSHQAVLKQRHNLSYPADLYLEGSDQHRGWFQSALITSVAIDNTSGYRSVLTHGFVVDGEGRKMSKSLGNVIAPQDIIKDFGADILRLWVASSDYNDDIRISEKIIARLTEAYRKIRNTARFILGNIYDFDPEADAVDYNNMLEVDRWAVLRAKRLFEEVASSYEKFQFHKVYHLIYSFCIVEMSNFYLDVLKDRLYTFRADSLQRRSCQSAMYTILEYLVTLLGPILSFTAEEIWQNMPKSKDMPKSIHMHTWPDTAAFKTDNGLEAKYQRLKKIREVVLKVLEEARVSGIIGSSLEAKVAIYTQKKEAFSFIEGYKDDLPALFIVSQAELKSEPPPANAVKDEEFPEISVVVEKAEGQKCARCWNYSNTVGVDSEYKDACQRCQDVLRHTKGDNGR
jgi:isoleucyl-tRNA synthetase